MARHDKFSGQHLLQYWRKWMIAALPLAIAVLFSLDWLANWERLQDPVEVRTVTAQDQYRPGKPSTEIISENEMAVWYADRVRYRYPAADLNRIETMLRAWEQFSTHVPPEVERYLVPIPPPIVFEAGFEGDLAAYRSLVEGLSQGAEIVDLYRVLEERKEEYTYYREREGLTNRGAYYAANELLEVLEGASLPPLEDYEEELYYRPDLENTYIYSLPESKGYCEAHIVTDGTIKSVKRPVIRKSGAGTGSVLPTISWAVVEGDGPEERSSLLLIGDSSGKVLVPFLANYYHQVYYISLSWNTSFGTDAQPVAEICDEYDISKIVYVLWGPDVGVSSKNTAFGAFMNRSQPAPAQAGGQDEGGIEE